MSVAAAATGVAKLYAGAKTANEMYKKIPHKKTIYNAATGGVKKVISKTKGLASSVGAKTAMRKAQEYARQNYVPSMKKNAMTMQQYRPSVASRGNGKDRLLPSSLLRKTGR